MPSSTTTEDAISMLAEQTPETLGAVEMNHEPNFLYCLHIVATKLRADMKMTDRHKGYDDLNQEAEEKCIPKSVFMLIKWIMQSETDPRKI